MQQAFDEVQIWTNDNSMNLNPPKTKEMLTSFATTNPPLITAIQINGEAVSQLKSSNLLGVTISDDLTWNEHIINIIKNASTGLYYLTILKCCRAPVPHLHKVYLSRIHLILEYSCQVWHPAFTTEHSNVLEDFQK